MRFLISGLLCLGLTACHSDSDSSNPVNLGRPAPFDRTELGLTGAQPGSLLKADIVFSFGAEEISQRLGALGLQAPAEHPIDIYRLVFLTLDLNGNPRPASGLAIFPRNDRNQLPMIHINHGTLVGDVNTPFNNPREGLFEAALGFAVGIPDYLGYGVSSDVFHPYLIEKSYVQNGLDFLRAFREFGELNGIEFPAFFMKGYSEGGYATLSMQKAIETDANLRDEFLLGDSFRLLASAPSGGPYLLSQTAKTLLTQPLVNPVYLTEVVASYNVWYDDFNIDYNDFFKFEAYQVDSPDQLANQIENEFLSGKFVLDQLFAIIPFQSDKFIQSRVVENFAALEMTPIRSFADPSQDDLGLASKIEENNLVKGWAPQVPTRFFHCRSDNVVPVQIAEATVQVFQALDPNTNISIQVYEDPEGGEPYGHGGCPAIFSQVGWFKQVLDSIQQ